MQGIFIAHFLRCFGRCRVFPFSSSRKAPPGPAAIGLGLIGVQVHGRNGGCQRQPVVEPARLPLCVCRICGFTPPMLRMAEPGLGAPCASLTWPVARLVVAACIDKPGKLQRRDGCAVNLKVRHGHLKAGALIVERKACRACVASQLNPATAHPHRPAGRHLRYRHATGRGVPQRSAQPAKSLAMHVFMEQRQAMEVQRVVTCAFCVSCTGCTGGRQGFNAGTQLLGEHVFQSATFRHGRCPARWMQQTGRVEVGVWPGKACRVARGRLPVAIAAMRAAQHPKFGKPGQMRQLPGNRVDAVQQRRHPLRRRQVSHQRPSAGPAVPQGRNQGTARELAGVCGIDCHVVHAAGSMPVSWLMKRLFWGTDGDGRAIRSMRSRASNPQVFDPANAEVLLLVGCLWEILQDRLDARIYHPTPKRDQSTPVREGDPQSPLDRRQAAGRFANKCRKPPHSPGARRSNTGLSGLTLSSRRSM